jgi:5'-nucleotidase
VPVVTTRGEYLYVGRLEVGFNSKGEIVRIGEASGPIRVIGGEEEDSVDADPALERRVVGPVASALRSMTEQVVATSETKLNGFHDDIRSRETNLGNLVADSLLWSAKQMADTYKIRRAEIAMVNGGGIRNGISAGTIHEIDIFHACPFPSFVTVVEGISPADLKGLLENAFSRVDSNGNIAGASGTGRFAQIAGFSVVYNPAREPGDRVKEVRLDNGELIVKDNRLVPGARSLHLATTDFLVNGGDEWDVGRSPRTGIGVTCQQAVTDFLLASPMIGGLGGRVAATAYPESETQRIVRE